MRAFIALELPDNAIEALEKTQERLREQELFEKSYTQPQNMHLTLKFLGDIDEETLAWVKERLETIDEKNFQARLLETGTFGKRIVWRRLEGVERLQAAIDEALKERFEKEERFMSHITIARPKRPKRGLKGLPRERPTIFTAKQFSIMESTLTSEGPRYKVIKRYRLENNTF